jgi:hypothetical protein
MVKFNETYSINNGQDSIVFKEGKGNNINGEYKGGVLTGTLDGNLLKATYHNKKNNIAGLIEISFTENGFTAKWKQGLELGPMKGKWIGKIYSVNDTLKEENSENKVGIYTALHDEDSDELIPSYSSEEQPYIIVIGFFGSHLVGTDDEWYGFVGYVITNTCDKCRTESVLFMDDFGQTISAHDMGGEASTEDGVDLVAQFKRIYPNEWAQIEKLQGEFFYCSEEEQDNDTLYLSLTKDIPKELQLTQINQGDWLDLEEVRKNNGNTVGLMIEL